MSDRDDIDELLAFMAHAIVRHAEVWRRNGARLPALAIPLARCCVAAQGGTARNQLGDGAAVGDGGDMASPEALLLTTRQVAKLLQVSERTVRAMVADGRLSAVKLGSATRIPRGDVEALAAGPPTTASPRFTGRVEVKASPLPEDAA